MGKAVVVSGGTDGLYRIKLEFARARVEAWKLRLQAVIAEAQTKVTELTVDLDGAEQQVATAISELNDAINIGEESAIGKAQEAVSTAAGTRDAIISLRQTQRASILAATKRLEQLEAIPEDPEIDAWCADFSEEIQGDVGTIEIPGEGIKAVVIQPGHEDAAEYAPARDGRMFHRAAQTPEQVFFNAAILPGWQRHRPTYRVGTVLSVNLNADTADVELDPATSSADGLPINPSTPNLTSVPVRYMTCNAVAFETGDRVILGFEDRDWTKAEVIGFESNPRPCGTLFASAMFQCRNEADAVVSIHRIILAINIRTREVRTQWVQNITATNPGMRGSEVFPINGSAFGVLAVDSGEPAASAAHHRAIVGADGSQASMATRSFSHTFDKGEVFGVLTEFSGGTSSANSQRYIVVTDPQTWAEKRRFEAFPSGGFAYTACAHDGLVAIGGYGGTAYLMRVYNTTTGALDFSTSVSNVIEDVQISDDFISVMRWGSPDHVVEVYDRATFAHLSSVTVRSGPNAHLIANGYLVTMRNYPNLGDNGLFDFYEIDDQGVATFIEGKLLFIPALNTISGCPGVSSSLAAGAGRLAFG